MKKGHAMKNQLTVPSLLSLCLLMVCVQTQAQVKKAHRKPAQASSVVTKLGIEFVETNSTDYHDKVDFAEVEHSHPISQTALQGLNMDNISQLSEEELDQVYARLSSGPIPNGAYKGKIIFEKDGGLQGLARYFTRNKIEEFLVDKNFAVLKLVGEYMWNGKHFYKSQGVLRNLIPSGPVQDAFLKSIPFALYQQIPDLTKVPKSVVNGVSYNEVFPAKLYCGQSLLDSRRESVIIDYAYSKDLPGYQEPLDVLASKDGLAVRDEVRMIRPGFYLGRAYMQRAFGLIFVLYNDEVAHSKLDSDAKDECWSGTQARPVVK
jgi:hypothetical protein